MPNPDELYIILDNYGLPQYGDAEAKTPHFFPTMQAARVHAEYMAQNNPNSVITVYRRVGGVFWDGVSWVATDA